MLRPILAFAVLFGWGGIGTSESSAQTPDISGPGPELYPRQPSFKLVYQLSRRVNFDGFDDPKLTLEGAILTLEKRYNLTLDLNERAFLREMGIKELLQQCVGSTPIPPMKDVPLAEVLRAVLARLSVAPQATFVINRDCVEITTRRQAMLEGWEAYRSAATIYAYRVESARVIELDKYAMEAVRLVSELAYWSQVMRENAKMFAATTR